jgi:hypothetical protein
VTGEAPALERRDSAPAFEALETVMRCYFMRAGHIASVEAIPGLPDDETIPRARELFEERRQSYAYDGFEVWELARVVFQYPTPIDDSRRRIG